MNSSEPTVCLKLSMTRSARFVAEEGVVLMNFEEIADVAEIILLSKATARENASEKPDKKSSTFIHSLYQYVCIDRRRGVLTAISTSLHLFRHN